MNKIKKIIILFMGVLMLEVVQAATEVVDGIIWEYELSDESATVLGAVKSSGSKVTGNIIVPPVLGNKPVTRISSKSDRYWDGAFRDCTGIQSIILPSTVSSIGGYSFDGCVGLKSIVLPDRLSEIGAYAFRKCKALVSINIPSNVTDIPEYAFANCESLREVSLPSGISSIGQYAFAECSSITEFLIPSGVTEIANDTFFGCVGLRDITIPNDVWSIESAAFAGCSGLTNVVIGMNVIYIGTYAFGPATSASNIDANHLGEKCENLSSMIFLGNAPQIESGRSGNESIYSVAPDFCIFVKKNSMGWDVDIPGTWKGYPIEYYKETTGESSSVYEFEWTVKNGSVTITKYIGSSERIEIPTMIDNMPVKAIAAGAFMSKSFVEEVVIPEGVTQIDRYAFEGTAFGDKVYTAMFKAAADSLVSGDNSTSGDASLTLTITNVVVHFVTQSLSSEAVIPTATSGIVNVIAEVNPGSAIAVTEEWAKQYEQFASKFGNNFTAAITAKTGKYDGTGKPMMVWQDYVAGTDPTDANDIFKASITFDKNSKEPIISWTPELSEAEAAKRSYKVFGKIKLTDVEWTLVQGDASDYNFFKVTVEMK